MLVYSLAAAIYLGGLGLSGDAKGILLWPAAVAHAAITLLMLRAWLGTAEPI
jgi:hypothetical protein